MSKISTYTTVAPTASDKLISTDVAGTPNDATKNFTAGSVARFLLAFAREKVGRCKAGGGGENSVELPDATSPLSMLGRK